MKAGSRRPAIALIGCSVLFLIGMFTFLSPCGPKEDGSYMNCHKAGTALTVIAVLIVLCAAALLFVKDNARTALSIAIFALCAAVIIIPGHVISLCMMPEMQCRAVMQKGSAVFAVLIALCAAMNLIMAHSPRKAAEDADKD